MQVDDVIRGIAKHSGKSGRVLSVELGHAPTWVSSVGARGRDPQLSSVVRVADLSGVDVCLVDRATGETIATIDPPEHQEPSH